MNKIYRTTLIFLFIFSLPLYGWKRRSILPRKNPHLAKQAQKSMQTRKKHADEFLTQNEAPAKPKKRPPIPTITPTPLSKKDVIETDVKDVDEKIVADEKLLDEEFPPVENATTEKENVISNENNNTEKQPPEEEQNDIYLNFENTSLSSFINYMAELKKINLIPNKEAEKAKISLTIREPVTLTGAWNIFLTIMEMANFSIVKVGDVHKILPKDKKLAEPLPIYIGTSSEELPNSDITIRYITFLNNITVEEVQPLLDSFLSSPHKVIAQPSINCFIITDKAYNIKSAMRVIHELDRTDVQQAVTVMSLRQANAKEVKELFDKLISSPDSGNPLARLLGRQAESKVEYFSSTVKIIAEERTNSLILLGDQKSIQEIEDFINEHVDKELKGVESPLHTYDLKYADAKHIKEVLDSIVNEQGDSTAAQTGGVRGGVKYFQKMKFEVDEDNNRLIASCTSKQDWQLLKKTIADLDKPQPQVAIETLIVSIDFNDEKEIGGQIRSKKANSLGTNIQFQAAASGPLITAGGESAPNLLGNLLTAITAGQGSTLLTFGAAANLWSFFKMLKSQSNTTVLSQPFIIASNMKKAELKVGETQYVLTEKATGDDGAASYGPAEANLTIDVTPQINLDGIINLDVKVVIEEFSDSSDGLPDKSTKSVDTKASVANGQVLVLGGFVKTKSSDTVYKSPLISKIPILGWLGKHKKRIIRKDYIFVFMSPSIIKPRHKPGMNLYTKMKLHQATNDIDEAIDVKKGNDPIHNWYFNYAGETYSHKVTDFANARYQPTTVDITEDPYYTTKKSRKKATPTKIKEKSLQQQNLPPELTSINEPIEELSLEEQRKQFKEILSHKPDSYNRQRTLFKESLSSPPKSSTPEDDNEEAA